MFPPSYKAKNASKICAPMICRYSGYALLGVSGKRISWNKILVLTAEDLMPEFASDISDRSLNRFQFEATKVAHTEHDHAKQPETNTFTEKKVFSDLVEF